MAGKIRWGSCSAREFGAERMRRPTVRRALAADGENNLQTLGTAPGEKDMAPLALRPRHMIAHRNEACAGLAQLGSKMLQRPEGVPLCQIGYEEVSPGSCPVWSQYR